MAVIKKLVIKYLKLGDNNCLITHRVIGDNLKKNVLQFPRQRFGIGAIVFLGVEGDQCSYRLFLMMFLGLSQILTDAYCRHAVQFFLYCPSIRLSATSGTITCFTLL